MCYKMLAAKLDFLNSLWEMSPQSFDMERLLEKERRKGEGKDLSLREVAKAA